MIVLALLSGLSAFLLFAASTEEHHQKRIGGRPSALRKRRLRSVAWVAVALCFAFAIAARGWIYGPVTWFGLLMLGAGAVFLSLHLLPVGTPLLAPRQSPTKRDLK